MNRHIYTEKQIHTYSHIYRDIQVREILNTIRDILNTIRETRYAKTIRNMLRETRYRSKDTYTDTNTLIITHPNTYKID